MGGAANADLLQRMAHEPATFATHSTRADDVCLIAFTSGTTGEPKGTMHFHRDMLATCDTYGAHVLRPRADDVFIGSAPLAFTFGLGAAVLFPLRVGACSILLEQTAPDQMLDAIRTLRPTVCFTAPTAYRAMLAQLRPSDTASLRICVSAGETSPSPPGTPGTPPLASPSWTALVQPRCCTSSSVRRSKRSSQELQDCPSPATVPS